MTPQSRKAKGRNLQKLTATALFERVGKYLGLVQDDFLSRSMGANGEDIIQSPASITKMGSWPTECKNKEALNVTTTFWEHFSKYKAKGTPILVHKRNKTNPLVTLTLDDFLTLLARSLGINDENKSTVQPE